VALSHAAKCFTVGHFVMSVPISAMIVSTSDELNPVTVVKSIPMTRFRWARALNGCGGGYMAGDRVRRVFQASNFMEVCCLRPYRRVKTQYLAV
jgi:hypothetical protein